MNDTATTDLTGALAHFASTLDVRDVPDGVKADARRLLLDSIGCMLAATHTRIAPIAYGMADFLGAGNLASIAGRRERASLAAALYANGRLANCMDLDETFPVGHHFGVGAVVAALALGEARRATGAQLLQALITGYELGGRVASASGPPMFIEDGFVTGYPDLYSFGASVVFAAAGVAIQLLGQDAALARQTLGIAGSNAPLPVMSKWSESPDLPDCKYADAGWASLAGVFAAQSAALGATGFGTIFDGDRGLIRMCGTESFDPDTLIGGFGSRWMLSDITYKPWPTCRWTHQPLTALDWAGHGAGVDVAKIASVLIETNVLLCTPRFRNPTPRTFCARQFSIPHAVAMLLLNVPVGPAWLDERQDDDPRVVALRNKVTVSHWDRANAFSQHIVHGQVRNMPARATITLTSGETFTAETEFALGDPWERDTAWSDEDVIAKFRIACGLDSARADALIEAVMNVDTLSDIEPIVGALRVI
ncbi:MmgE/PrpD family protein [Paraburkholderia sp. ZP32-5]|uniref:MmgE/PrpD family protein n=1 Tax=Paraburkholderia sp. ZP32-5 TaxID=2883245 RepID=UPI001F3F0751|nr:MmgE/PrpD family protein [Paraburkholderia sp. ZP32-5]